MHHAHIFSIDRIDNGLEVKFTRFEHEPDRILFNLPHNRQAAAMIMPYVEGLTGISWGMISQLPENTGMFYEFKDYHQAERCWLVYATASRAFDNGMSIEEIQPVITELAAQITQQEDLDRYMSQVSLTAWPEDLNYGLDYIIDEVKAAVTDRT